MPYPLAALVALLAFPLPALGQEGPPVPLERSILVGRVVDARGAPIAGANVELRSMGKPWTEALPADALEAEMPDGSADALTDAGGRFRFDVPVPTSRWISLRVTSSPFHERVHREFGLLGDREPIVPGTNDLGDLVLKDAGAVGGRVVDERGSPIEHAHVSLEQRGFDGESVSCSSDPEGAFLLGHAPAGRHSVSVHHDGYLMMLREGIVVSAGSITGGLELVLADAPVVEGRVVDPSGRPLAGVRISGWPVGSGWGAGARSGEDGRFTLRIPQREPYRLEATLQGHDPYVESHTSAGHPPGSTDVEIVLRPLPWLSFVVVDAATGAPIERYGLQFRPGPGPDERGFSTADPPNEDLPTYAFPGGRSEWWAEPGRDAYFVQAPGYAPRRGIVELDVPGGDRQTIRLTRGGGVEGKIERDGQPVAGLVVHLERASRSIVDPFVGRRRTAVTDDLGRFAFADLAAASYRVEPAAGPLMPYEKCRVEVPAVETVRLDPLRVGTAAEVFAEQRKQALAAGRSARAELLPLSNATLAARWGPAGGIGGPQPEGGLAEAPSLPPSILPAEWTIDSGAARTTVTVLERQIRMARLPGAAVLLVNGEAFVGDPERRGFQGVPIELLAGENALEVRGIGDDGFALELWAPATRVVLATWDVWYPRGGGHEMPGRPSAADALTVPVFNASTAQGTLHTHYAHAVQGAEEPPKLTDWSDGHRLPPLGLALPSYWLFDLGDEVTEWTRAEALTSVAVWADGDENADRRSFRLTVDHSGLAGRPRRPVRWALGAPDRIVHGGTGTEAGDRAAAAAARFLQQVFWYHGDLAPELVASDAFSGEPEREEKKPSPRLLFVGDARTLPFPASLVTAARALARGAKDHAGDTLVARALDGRVGVLHGTSAAAFALMSEVDPFDDRLAGEVEVRWAKP